jgi:hypothetical protein
MQRLMDGGYQQALNIFLSALEKLAGSEGYQRDVAGRLIGSELFSKCQEFTKVQWSKYLTVDGLSNEEIIEINSALNAISVSG